MSPSRSDGPSDAPSDAPGRRDEQRVVVTGIGLVTALGADRETTWRNVIAAQRGVAWLPEQNFVGARAQLAEPGPTGELIIDLALAAADEAVRDAGRELPAERTGCVIGCSKGGIRSFDLARSTWRATGVVGREWDLFPAHVASSYCASRFGVRGPVLCPVAACATGLVSIGRGVDLIREGACDVVLAGSSDSSLEPLLLASYKRLGVLAPVGEDPASTCRPFDLHRGGFAAGEGAAVLVLERRDLARERNAHIYGEWLGGGLAADPSHGTLLEADAQSLAGLIQRTLQYARVSPAEIDYVNLHGTATRLNDRCETAALHSALGERALSLAHANRLGAESTGGQVVCSSLKGAIGHLLGAAGSVELALTFLALRDGIVPPTVNLQHPDPECDLDYCPNVSRQQPLRTALKLSLGFGGHLAAAVIRRDALDD